MGSWIASELVGDESPRRFPLSLQDLAEEAFCRSLVPTLGHQNIQHIAVLRAGDRRVTLSYQPRLLYFGLVLALIPVCGVALARRSRVEKTVS